MSMMSWKSTQILSNSSSFHNLFIWETRRDIKRIPDQGTWSLSNKITENRLRHTSGPVHATIPLHLCKTGNLLSCLVSHQVNVHLCIKDEIKSNHLEETSSSWIFCSGFDEISFLQSIHTPEKETILVKTSFKNCTWWDGLQGKALLAITNCR